MGRRSGKICDGIVEAGLEIRWFLARGASGEVCLDYLSSMQLLVEIR